jgi:hypothetical protein
MVSWDQCKEDFRQDGSLRDIYITPATLADWRAIYPALCNFPELEFSVDGVVQPPPATVDEVFTIGTSARPMLRFSVGRVLVVFHFFGDEEVECDVSPHEITSQADLVALLSFVGQLGDLTGRHVLITPENCREQPFITYYPDSKTFEHHKISL